MTPAPDMPYRYRAYGCNIASDIPFLQLMPGMDPALDTISIRRCDTLPDAPEEATRLGPFSIAAPNFLSVNVDQVVHIVALSGDTLLYRPHEKSDATSLQVFLLGSGLGGLLMQRKFLVMHGNAVQINGTCTLCVGKSGAGKSTTAAGLMQRGFRVMSDDVCAINDYSQIIPGIPHIKLWQNSADHLEIKTEGLSRIRPELEKYRIPMDDAFLAGPLSIKRVYVLSPAQTDTVTCETITGHKKLAALRANTYRLPFVKGMGLESLHFRQIAHLAQQVTVKLVRRPTEGFKLDQLLDVLIADATGQAPDP